MWRITLLGLRAHRLRYMLTALSVLLSVAFLAGTLVFTDTIRRTFDGLFTDVYRSTSAVVRATEPFTPGTNYTSQRDKIDASVADVVRTVPGVAEVRLGIEGYAQLVGRDGKAIGNPAAGAPTLGEAWNDIRRMNPYRFVTGGPPTSVSEVAIDKHSADVGHLAVGDEVLVLTKQPPARYRITGIFRWGTADSPLGASITLFDQATATRVLGQPGKVDEIAVAAQSGVSQQEMVRRLRAALPDPKLEIVTGAKITQEGQSAVHKALGFLNTFLLVFAFIALFVSSFQIFNTFSIVVAQRLRELALLRAVGASRGQVTRAVLGESFVIGFVASGLGLAGGIALAIVLRALLSAVGFSIPSTGLLITSRTVLLSIVAGTLITVVAASLPARKAGRVAPMAALREAEVDEETRPGRRSAAGGVVTAGGLALLAAGLFGSGGNRVALVGAGAAIVFLGLAVLGPVVSRPLSGAFGALVRWRGTSGQLARNNAMRNPKRTAATSAALMVGVALVALMSVAASSMKSSITSVVDTAMRADFVVSGGGYPGGASGFSPALQQRLATLPEVAASTGVRAAQARVAGSTSVVLAVDPAQADTLFDVGVMQGDLARMTPTGIAVSKHVADAKGLHMGDRLPVVFARTGTRDFTVQAIYTARGVAGDYVLPIVAAESNFSEQLDFQVYVKLAPGVDATAARRAIEGALAAYPNAKLLDRTEYKKQQLAQVNQLLSLVYGLLALALTIALIGIANTLALSIHERTRELGLLRAVGMTRAQVRSTVRLESVIIALLGAAEGLVVGTLFGCAVVVALHSQGVSVLTIPVGQLIAVAVVAGLAGVIAAISPSRRAARLDVLRAITTE